jgi:hypothetical protein
MTEMMTLQLDESVMERLRLVARAHHCTVEALAAQVLDDLLPCAADVEPNPQGDWEPEEAAFLDDAAQAFESIQPLTRASVVPMRSAAGRSRS